MKNLKPNPPIEQRTRAYTRHLSALRAAKPHIDCQKPTSTTFSHLLSGTGGKKAALYDLRAEQIHSDNAKLLAKMTSIFSNPSPLTKAILNTSKNPGFLRLQERRKVANIIQAENLALLHRIENVAPVLSASKMRANGAAQAALVKMHAARPRNEGHLPLPFSKSSVT
jgi:Hemingway/CFA97